MSDGWMPGAERIEARPADRGSGTTKPTAIVNHIMQGYQRTMLDWAKNGSSRGVSAHFTIGRDGRVVQHVSIFQPAYHAGLVRSPVWSGVQYRAGVPVNPNLYTVGIEHEGFSVDPGYGYDYLYSGGRTWPKAMVDATVRVQKWVCETAGLVPGVDTIIGHYAIDGISRANDPGTAWPRLAIIEGCKPKSPPKEKPVALTAEQKQMVDYLNSAEGKKNSAAAVRYYLDTVGLKEMPTGTTTPAPSTSGPTGPEVANALRLIKEAQGRLEAAEKLLEA